MPRLGFPSPGLLIRLRRTKIENVLSCWTICTLIFEPSVHELLDYLINNLPRNMRVVIASRHDPPLGMAPAAPGARWLKFAFRI